MSELTPTTQHSPSNGTRRRVLALSAALAGAALLPACATRGTPASTASEAWSYVFVHFVKNGADGLHLAVSDDGYRWERVNDGLTVMVPTVGKSKLVRDPCVVRGPDGLYHMVWTSGWNENNIGYARSKDLVHWSPQQEIPVMAHEPDVLNTWAPEIVYDDRRGEYLIHWASTIPGKFTQTAGTSEEKYNHRIYATTTRDFKNFTPARVFYDPGFSVIDATFIKYQGKDFLIVKDETVKPPKKYIQVASAPDLQGPFGVLGAPVTAKGLWSEGPTGLQIGDHAVMYFDAYMDQKYVGMRSRDMVNWEDVTGQMHFPDEGTPLRMRHGTVIPIPRSLAKQLRATRINLGVKP